MPQSTQPLNRMIFSLNKFVFSPSCLLCCDEFWPLCHQHLGIGVICWRALLFVRFRPQFRILSEKASWGQTGLRAPLDPSQERPRGTSSYLTCSRPLMMPFAQSRKQRKPLSRIHEFDAWKTQTTQWRGNWTKQQPEVHVDATIVWQQDKQIKGRSLAILLSGPSSDLWNIAA